MSATSAINNTGNKPGFLEKITKHTDIALAIGIIGIVFVLLFPIPTLALDILLAFSISTGIMILMTTLFIEKPLELSSFPTLLLVTAILRLSLNIASTRLILANGHMGTKSAGHVIEAFGSFVMQGSIVIGIIVFIILTIINFIVITKGSGRIAEVAARFSLDAMPGKQMAIDADMAAGLINEEVAKTRRKELEQESAFFGAMDGANKFVRGDAIAGILITFINLIGGIIIGIVQRGLSLEKAAHTYTILTIGDGLVSQIPSLIISLSAGLLVSKAGVSGSADKAIFGQLGKYPQALWLSSIVTGLMAFLPGLPFAPFLLLAASFAVIAYNTQKLVKNSKSSEQNLESESNSKKAEKTQDEIIAESLNMDSVRVELGYNLLQLINYQKGSKLTEQIKALRTQIAKDLGFVIPSVRVQDNMQLGNNEYVIKLKEIECARGELQSDKLMVMNPLGKELNIDGQMTSDPAFGLPAKWIDERLRDEAIFNGYTVVDPPTILITHLTEVIKENMTELISYSETQSLIDKVSEEHKKLIKDVIPDQVQISTLQKILQNLLKESVSIRDLPAIIEAIADGVKITNNLSNLTEIVRSKLSRQISYANVNDDGFIPVLTLSTNWESIISQNITGPDSDKQLSLPPSQLQDLVRDIKKSYEEQALKGIFPVLLTSPKARPYVRYIIERFRPTTVVLSQSEIYFKIKIKTLGVI